MLQIGLADALDRGGHIHDFVGEHARQPLPRLDLVLHHQLVDFLPQVVQGFLEGLFSVKKSFERQMKGKVAIPDSFAHQMGPHLQFVLMVTEEQYRQGYDQQQDQNRDNHFFSLL